MNQASPTDVELFKRRIEAAKFWTDYLKHLTTLSTGSLLLTVTFLERVFVHPLWKWGVIVTTVGFLISVLGSVTALTVLALTVETWDEDGNFQINERERLGRTALYISWLGFLIAVFSLAVFAVRNLLPN